MLNGEWWEMMEGKDEGFSLTSKIIRDDEDELESDDLYSDEDLSLNSLGNLRCIQPLSDWGNVEKWKEQYGNNMRIIDNDLIIK